MVYNCSFLMLLLLMWVVSFSSALRTITHLPGFDGPLPFSFETGYVEVDEEKGVELFYYFIESESNPEEDPLMLWLTGGPGCSAFSGLVIEIGPLRFNLPTYTHGLPSLYYKPQSWTQLSNVIFLDSPVGTGFSYSRTEEGYISSDTVAVQQILVFLSKWLEEHPQFKSNPLYITGDSYSGMIIPVVTLAIAMGEVSADAQRNLKGYTAGNPKTDIADDGMRIPYAHGMGLISDELFEATKQSCGGKYTSPENVQCSRNVEAVKECIQDVNDAHILEPHCEFHSPHPTPHTSRQLFQYSSLPLECRTSGYLLLTIWANNETVRESLGIHQGSVPYWQRCNYDILYTENRLSVIEFHRNVTARGYRALVYSGDHDMSIPFTSTTKWIKSLNYSIVDDWRPWYVGGQVAGFTRSYSNNLTFATVKGAGHTAPEYKPKECLAMLERWLSGLPL